MTFDQTPPYETRPLTLWLLALALALAVSFVGDSPHEAESPTQRQSATAKLALPRFVAGSHFLAWGNPTTSRQTQPAMVVEYIRYVIPEDRREGFVEAYAAASEQLDASDYCLGYELSQCEEEPKRFVLRIEWTSTEDHLNGFRQSEAFQKFLGHVRPYYSDIAEMTHYRPTEVLMARDR